MTRRSQLGTALVVLAVALFLLPALFPVQAVLVHDTGPITFDGQEEIENEGIEIVGYENLSERGQELYVRTLEAGGEYQLSLGEGAPDFEYLTSEERSRARDERSVQRPGVVAIDRSTAADLPPADEPFKDEPREGRAGEDEHRQTVQRYDLMETSTEPPGLGSGPQLFRLAAALLAVISLGIGGYLLSSN